MITDGTGTLTFAEVGQLILTDWPDIACSGADDSGARIGAGAGDDTISIGAGDDTVFGDTLIATGPNRIVNGSFEDTTKMDPTPSWGVSGTGGVAPGWTDATGFAVEFQNDGNGGLDATDGANWLDLEVSLGQNSAISQSIADLVDGQTHILTFDADDLSNADDGSALDNKFQVIWNGNVVATIDPSDGSWTTYTFYVTGGAGTAQAR